MVAFFNKNLIWENEGWEFNLDIQAIIARTHQNIVILNLIQDPERCYYKLLKDNLGYIYLVADLK